VSRRGEIIAEAYDRWEQDWVGRTQPDPQYQHGGPSQYAEGVVALSAGADADADLHRRVQAALAAEGLLVNPWG
jgi:hypothetical protein